MPDIREIMSADVQSIEPEETLRRGAELMRDLDIGALPVCSDGRLLGMVTDRDLAVRGLADGLDPDNACISDVMTPDPETCRPEQDAQEVLRAMGDAQVRRMPVVDDDGRLVGIVSLGDMATRQGADTDEALREISEPG